MVRSDLPVIEAENCRFAKSGRREPERRTPRLRKVFMGNTRDLETDASPSRETPVPPRKWTRKSADRSHQSPWRQSSRLRFQMEIRDG